MKQLPLVLCLMCSLAWMPSRGESDTEVQEVNKLLNEENPYAEGQLKLTIIPQDEDIDGAYYDEYPSLPAEMRNFWAGVTPPSSSSEIEWLRQFFEDVEKYTKPHFVISGGTPYKEIPFEELSESDAYKSAKWYMGASAYVRISPDYLRFYNEVIYPKMDAVLRVYAKRRQEVKTQGDLNSTDWSRGSISTRKSFDVGFGTGVQSNDYFLYYFHRVESPEALFSKSKKSKVTVSSTIYYFPKSYRSLVAHNKVHELTIYAHCTNEHDEHVLSTDRSTETSSWRWVTKNYAVELYFDPVYCTKEKETGDYTRCENTILTFKTKDELWPKIDDTDLKDDSWPKKNGTDRIEENDETSWSSVIIIGICLIFCGLKIVQKSAGV